LEIGYHILPRPTWITILFFCFALEQRWHAHTTMPSYWLRWRLMNFFAWNHNPLNLKPLQ
jgi:hypothetical protein